MSLSTPLDNPGYNRSLSLEYFNDAGMAHLHSTRFRNESNFIISNLTKLTSKGLHLDALQSVQSVQSYTSSILNY